MQHPDPGKIRDAMDLLSEYEEGRRTFLDMRTPNAWKSPLCGTVACFAGHFHIAQRRRRKKRVDWADVFITGAFDFTRHIFGDTRTIECLCRWAADNPELWGNEHGSNLFYSAKAYGSKSEFYTTLRRIIDHWIGVADRIEAHNAAS